jgi:pimeloyl-ACP methyl ester carboxylesterase
MLGEKYAERLQSELVAPRLTLLPRCGHIPQRECPIAFTSKLSEILKQKAPQLKASKPVLGASSAGAQD